MHLFAVATLDQPIHDPLARIVAEIGPQKGQRRDPLRVGFELAAKGRQDFVKMPQFLRREAARAIRRQCQDIDQTVGKPNRHRDVISCTLVYQILQDRKVELRVRTLQPAADAALAGDDRRKRAVHVLRGLQTGVGCLILFDVLDATLPGVGMRE